MNTSSYICLNKKREGRLRRGCALRNALIFLLQPLVYHLLNVVLILVVGFERFEGLFGFDGSSFSLVDVAEKDEGACEPVWTGYAFVDGSEYLLFGYLVLSAMVELLCCKHWGLGCFCLDGVLCSGYGVLDGNVGCHVCYFLTGFLGIFASWMLDDDGLEEGVGVVGASGEDMCAPLFEECLG